MTDPIAKPSLMAKAALITGRMAHKPFEVPEKMTNSAYTTGAVLHNVTGDVNTSARLGVEALQPRGFLGKILGNVFDRVDTALEKNASQAQKATELFWRPFSEGSHQIGFAVSNPFASFYAKRAGFELPSDGDALRDMLRNEIIEPDPHVRWPQPTPADETPEAPEIPETPDVPEVPEVPENPEAPEAPEIPEVPGTPEIPEVPETPGDPDAPQEPDLPNDPLPGEPQPDEPQVPDEPQIPDEPQQPEVPQETPEQSGDLAQTDQPPAISPENGVEPSAEQIDEAILDSLKEQMTALTGIDTQLEQSAAVEGAGSGVNALQEAPPMDTPEAPAEATLGLTPASGSAPEAAPVAAPASEPVIIDPHL